MNIFFYFSRRAHWYYYLIHNIWLVILCSTLRITCCFHWAFCYIRQVHCFCHWVICYFCEINCIRFPCPCSYYWVSCSIFIALCFWDRFIYYCYIVINTFQLVFDFRHSKVHFFKLILCCFDFTYRISLSIACSPL